MAYNPFPVGYQPMVPQFPQYQQPAQNNGMIWVSGEAGAKAYMVAPNSTVQLWDSEAQVVYIKSADASGMPSMKVLDYTIRNAPNSLPNGPGAKVDNYATKDDIAALKAEIDDLRGKLKEADHE